MKGSIADLIIPQFIGLTSHEIVFFPEPTPPASITASKATANPRKTEKILASPLTDDPSVKKGIRFNDGGCDPQGRLFAGSMTLPELKDGKKRGELWR